MRDDGKSRDDGTATPASGMADVLGLPAHLRDVVTWMMRRGVVSLDEIVSRLGGDVADARKTVEELVERGLVQRAGEDRYRARPARRTRPRMPGGLWQALEARDDE